MAISWRGTSPTAFPFFLPSSAPAPASAPAPGSGVRAGKKSVERDFNALCEKMAAARNLRNPDTDAMKRQATVLFGHMFFAAESGLWAVQRHGYFVQLTSLKNVLLGDWMDYDTISSYLSGLVSAVDKNALFVDSLVPILTNPACIPSALEGALKRHSTVSGYPSKLLVPVCVPHSGIPGSEGNHWALYYCTQNAGTGAPILTYWDPRGAGKFNREACFAARVETIVEALFGTPVQTRIFQRPSESMETVPSGTECGPLVCLLAGRFLFGNSRPTSPVPPEFLENFRQEIVLDILAPGFKPAAFRLH